MAFAEKQITVTVQLAQNSGTNQPSTFAESGTNTVTITNQRMQVRIQNSGSPVDNRAEVKIWGMTASLMNQLATLGLVFNLVPKNVITVTANEAGKTPATVFTGTIWSAYGDYSAQPEVPFVFNCLAGGAESVISVPPTSVAGPADVATLMSGFARQMGMGFENNGVNLSLNNPYLTGSAKLQAQKCAEHAGISWGTVNGNVLAIWPKGGNRNTPNPVLISKSGTMIGYPAFTQQGIIVKDLFNPQVSFGGLIKVDSSVLAGVAQAQAAKQGTTAFPTQWAVNKLDLALDALLPNGDWMSVIYAYNPNYARSIIPP